MIRLANSSIGSVKLSPKTTQTNTEVVSQEQLRHPLPKRVQRNLKTASGTEKGSNETGKGQYVFIMMVMIIFIITLL